MSADTAWRSALCIFAADHPAAKGHFPDNPIIPGAVLLQEAIAAITIATSRELRSGAIRAAKFLAPVRPGDRMQVRWHIARTQEIKFECSLETGLVVTGSLTLGEDAA